MKFETNSTANEQLFVFLFENWTGQEISLIFWFLNDQYKIYIKF